MNQLTFNVSSEKLRKAGLSLNADIKTDIKDTLHLFRNIKNEM